MAKNKKDQPKLNFEGKEYIIENMSEESKRILNHINDIQNKLNTNAFVKEQLDIGKEAFVNMLKKSLEENNDS
jgi:CxxC motif-containing protein|tara:strand:+ start:845 stop:1063 length:219 start_codon:yes stop_codon:yes gene_type:complete